MNVCMHMVVPRRSGGKRLSVSHATIRVNNESRVVTSSRNYYISTQIEFGVEGAMQRGMEPAGAGCRLIVKSKLRIRR